MKKSTKKLNKLCSLATILLIIGLIIPVSTAYASNLGDQSDSGQSQQTTATQAAGNENNNQTTNPTATPSPNATPSGNQGLNSNENQQEAKANATVFPGVPDNAVQCNKTDVTPVAQREQVRAQEPTLFRYRNMTMLMNCSRNCEVVFTADQEVSPKLLGLSVEPNQTVSLTMNLSKSPLQGAMVMQRSLNFYLGIEPNATLQFRAQIRLYINQTELNQELSRTVNASRLRWMFWNQTKAEWQIVESYMDQNGYLVCNTDHFSTWTVAEITQDTENSADTKTSNNFPVEYVIAGVAVAIIVVALAVVSYKRRK
jgi:hypothetical protein